MGLVHLDEQPLVQSLDWLVKQRALTTSPHGRQVICFYAQKEVLIGIHSQTKSLILAQHKTETELPHRQERMKAEAKFTREGLIYHQLLVAIQLPQIVKNKMGKKDPHQTKDTEHFPENSFRRYKNQISAYRYSSHTAY